MILESLIALMVKNTANGVRTKTGNHAAVTASSVILRDSLSPVILKIMKLIKNKMAKSTGKPYPPLRMILPIDAPMKRKTTQIVAQLYC